MTNVASNTPAAKPETVETRQIVLKEISAKRGKFSEQDFSALKGQGGPRDLSWPSTA